MHHFWGSRGSRSPFDHMISISTLHLYEFSVFCCYPPWRLLSSRILGVLGWWRVHPWLIWLVDESSRCGDDAAFSDGDLHVGSCTVVGCYFYLATGASCLASRFSADVPDGLKENSSTHQVCLRAVWILILQFQPILSNLGWNLKLQIEKLGFKAWRMQNFTFIRLLIWPTLSCRWSAYLFVNINHWNNRSPLIGTSVFIHSALICKHLQ